MPSQPLVIGHRGASAIAPENTLAAFKRAIDAGADGVEFDVRLSSDGVPVIIHDETLQRTGSLKRRVRDLSAAELQQVNVGSWFSRERRTTKEFADEKVPTLQQLFDLFASNRALLYLEMKCSPEERAQLAAACCYLVTVASLRERVVFECFDLAALEAVKGIDPGMRTAALFEPKLTSPSSLLLSQRLVDRAKAVGAEEIALHHALASTRLIDRANLAGLKIVVWTVDDPAWIQRAQLQGIDALISNDPATMLRQRDTLPLV